MNDVIQVDFGNRRIVKPVREEPGMDRCEIMAKDLTKLLLWYAATGNDEGLVLTNTRLSQLIGKRRVLVPRHVLREIEAIDSKVVQKYVLDSI